MTRVVLFLAVIATLAPSAEATAFLGMRTGPNTGLDEVDAVVAPGSGEHFLDLLLYAYGEDPNDHMNEYDVMVRAGEGVTLLRAEKPVDWAFTGPGTVFAVLDTAPDHLFINASSADERVDIPPSGSNVARIYYSIAPGTAPGRYPITLEPGTTRVYSAVPGDLIPPVDVSDPGLILVTPEPSGLAIVAVGGLLALRRRRTPGALE